MGVNVLEYWRGTEDNRALIGMGSWYKELDPDAFYLGANCDCDGDQVEPQDMRAEDLQRVLTFDSPFEPAVERELYVGAHCGILIEDANAVPMPSGELGEV